MGFCCVLGCPNKTHLKRKAGVSFHRFPTNQALKEQWIRAVHRENWTPNKYSLVCSEHFLDNCLNRSYANGHTELRKNSVPTVFPQACKSQDLSHESSVSQMTQTEESASLEWVYYEGSEFMELL